jgi:hypothetical protein
MAVDPQVRAGVFGGGAVLVVAMSMMQFCGTVSLPPKPPPPAAISGTQQQLMTRTEHSPTVYLDYLRSDAAAASIATVPSLQDMQRKFAYHADDSSRMLAPGQPPIEVAGLRLHLEVSGDSIVMKIDNLLPSDAAYEISTVSTLGTTCNGAPALPFDAMVIKKGSSETRTECVYRPSEASLRITRVETMELPPLSSYYVEHVPPSLVGIEERFARGHQQSGDDVCSEVVPQSVRAGIEQHQISWRDLVDFYARHRCQTYQFPPTYRALMSDGERPIPAVDAKM